MKPSIITVIAMTSVLSAIAPLSAHAQSSDSVAPSSTHPAIHNPAAINPANVKDGAANHLNSAIDWDSENSYWRKNYTTRSYHGTDRNYEIYEPAYRFGVDMYSQSPDTRFDDLDQTKLHSGWERSRGDSKLSWDDAKSASRDAYNRLYERKRSGGSTDSTTKH